MRWPPGFGRALAVVAVFAALTAVLAFPLSLAPATRALPLSADTRLFLWTLSWDVHALTHRPLHLFDANIFYPEPRTLAYSEHLVGSAVVGAPFLLATGNPVLAMNVVVLLSCVLSGAGAFLLARRLGIGTAGALVAGVVFAFAPPRFTRLAQLHLATVQWIPFCLAFVHSYLQGRRRRDLLVAIAFFTLQSLTSGHGGLFLLLALLALGGYLAVTRRLPPLGTLARDVGVAGVLLLAVNLPFLVPYFLVQRELGLRRTIGAVYDWAPNAASFLASPTHVDEALLSLAPPLERAVADAKAYMFPGWLTLMLLGALVLSRRRREDLPRAEGGSPLAFYAVLALVSLWASLGPPFGLYTALYRLLPGFDLIRVPSRLAILTLLALAVLAGAGADRLLERVRPAARAWTGGALVLLLAGEFAACPLKAPAYAVEVGEVDRWLAERERPFAVVELPVAAATDAVASARNQSHYMLHSMLHWQPTVNGYSGFVPPRHEALFDQLTRFPDEGSVRALEKLGVNYVVVHRGDYGEEAFARIVAGAQAFPTRLIPVHEAPDGRVYSVRFAKPKGQW
jgi:MYXO-CTERM domain-containing protein